jgi:acetoin utilization deacetylase AcuC-like enzyme
MLKIAWAEAYHHPLPSNHRFPMEKYSLLPTQLMHDGTANRQNFFHPDPATDADLLRVHQSDYLRRLDTGTLSKQEIRKIGFPFSPELLQRERLILGGTIQNALFALEYGCSFNIAGGTHHAYRASGEGFCLLNDIAVAAAYLLAHQKASRILVVDLDVHQGNGTAEIFQNEPRVFTFSMHGAHNYPLHKEQSDLDVPLADGTDDATYLDLLSVNLDLALARHQPDFIFFQAGVDILASDKLGRLGVSIWGCKQRDILVFDRAYKRSIPVAVSMGGGYSEKIVVILEAHANTFRAGNDIFF